jgi:acyl-coenzyme A synthetase/AMP-(fatty) acid ligase
MTESTQAATAAIPMNTIPARLAQRAAERPDDLAHLTDEGAGLTFSDWYRAACAAARGLKARGVSEGDRVVVPCSGKEVLDVAVAYAAVGMVGAAVVLVPRVLGAEALARLCEVTAPVGVIDSEARRYDSAAAGAPWRSSIADLRAGQSSEPYESAARALDLAAVMCSSGSTGTPEAVGVTHANWLATHRAEGAAASEEWRVIVHASRPGTQVGDGLLLLPLNGRPHQVVTVTEPDPVRVWAAIDRYRPSHLVLVPSMACALVAWPEEDCDVSSVSVIRLTSAATTDATVAALAKHFPQADIIDYYSSVQAWPAAVKIRRDGSRPGSLGRIVRGAELRVVGEDGREVAAGGDGAIELRQEIAPARTPYGDPNGRPTSFLPGGWVATGDVGHVDQEGYLYLTGRSSEILNVGGVKVALGGIEQAAAAYPGVQEVACVGLAHPTLGHVPVAVVLPVEGFGDDQRRALLTDLTEQFGARAPHAVVVVDALPRTAAGKVDKPSLGRMVPVLLSSAEPADADEVPTGEQAALYAAVRAIWVEVLGGGVEPAGGSQWSGLGGDSIGSRQVVAAVRTRLGRDVAGAALAPSTTLAEFTAAVAVAGVREGAAVSTPRGRKTGIGSGTVTEYPATRRQEWYARTARDGGSTLVAPMVALLREPDVPALRTALQALAVRHPALRSSFLRGADGGLVQWVHDRRVLWVEVDQQPATWATSHRIRAAVLAAMDHPMVVVGGPLARALLRDVGSGLHVLVVVVHHAVCDGVSTQILARDLEELYRAELEERRAVLPPVSDELVCGGQADTRSSADAWANRIRGAWSRLDLGEAADVARPSWEAWAMRPVAGGAAALATVARQRAVTAGVVAIAAVVEALRGFIPERHTIGVWEAGRDDPARWEAVGDFAQLLPVPLSLGGCENGEAVTRAVEQALSEAMNQPSTLGALAELRGSEDGPLLDLSVNFLPAPAVGRGDERFMRIEPPLSGRRYGAATWGADQTLIDVQLRSQADGTLEGTVVVAEWPGSRTVAATLANSLSDAFERLAEGTAA